MTYYEIIIFIAIIMNLAYGIFLLKRYKSPCNELHFWYSRKQDIAISSYMPCQYALIDGVVVMYTEATEEREPY